MSIFFINYKLYMDTLFDVNCLFFFNHSFKFHLNILKDTPLILGATKFSLIFINVYSIYNL